MAKQPTLPTDARLAIGTSGTLTLLGLAVDDPTFGMFLGVVVLILLIFAMTRVPARYSMMTMLFFATALPNPAEGQPTNWEPPFSLLGRVLLNHLNTVDRAGFLGMIPVSGMEILFFVLYVILIHRRVTKSTIDGTIIPTPKPLIQLAQLSLMTSGFTWLVGMASGGNFGMSLWQLNAVMYLPVVFLLMQAVIRGPQDHWPLARLYLVAAAYKSCVAYYVVENIHGVYNVYTKEYEKPPYGTAHADSMLFSLSFVIVLAPLLEQINRRTKMLAVFLLPILALGTKSNNRRLAWVQIAVVFLIVYLVSRETRAKRFIRRVVIASIPILVVYVISGWNNRYGGFYKPVRMLRSVVDAETDASSQWREFENVNIIATFRHNMIFGTGYGHPYEEVIRLPAVEYPLEQYIPHNSMLGLWGYTGIVGFAGLTMLWVVGIYLAMRAYHGAKDPMHRVASIVSFGVAPIYFAQCWGDLGLSAWSGVFMMGTAIAVAGKLAVITGEWRGGSLSRSGRVV